MPVDFQEETPSLIDFVEESGPTMQLAPIAPARSPEELSARQAAGQAALGTAPRGEPIVQSPFSTGLPIPRLPGVEEKPATWPEIAVAMLQPGTAAAMRMVGPNVPAQIGRKGLNVVPETVDFLLSPGGMLTAGISGLGAWASKLVAAGFSLDMLKSLYEQGRETLPNWGKLTDEQKAGALAEMAKTAGFAAATGFHAAKPRVKAVPPILPKEEVPVEAPKVAAAPEPAAPAAEPKGISETVTTKPSIVEGVPTRAIGKETLSKAASSLSKSPEESSLLKTLSDSGLPVYESVDQVPNAQNLRYHGTWSKNASGVVENGLSDGMSHNYESFKGVGGIGDVTFVFDAGSPNVGVLSSGDVPHGKPIAAILNYNEGGTVNPSKIKYALRKAQPKKVYAPEERKVEEGVQPERVGTETQRIPAETGVSDSLQPTAEKPGGEGAVSPPEKAAEVLLKRDWDLFYENLADNLESFSDARRTGKIDYDMQDVAQRFVDYAKQDTSGKPLDKLVSDFAKSDEASAGQIRKLRQSVKSLLEQEYWKTKGEESASIQKDIDESAIEYIQKYPDAAKASIVKQQGMDAYLKYKAIADERAKAVQPKAPVAEPAAEPSAPKPKEPWEMTADEFEAASSGAGPNDPIISASVRGESGKVYNAKLHAEAYNLAKQANDEPREGYDRETSVGYTTKSGKFITSQIAENRHAGLSGESLASGKSATGKAPYQHNPEHLRAIRQALREGKPVPPEVLKDYPDLQKPQPPAAPTTTAEGEGKGVLDKIDEELQGKWITPAIKGQLTRKRAAIVEGQSKGQQYVPYRHSEIGSNRWGVVDTTTGNQVEFPVTIDHPERGKIQTTRINFQTKKEALDAIKSKPPPAAPAEGQGPGIVGMGGAVPEEFKGGAGVDIYGIAQRVREERAKAGQVKMVEPGLGISAQSAVEHGRELIRSGVNPETVLSNFEKTSRASWEDMTVARAHGEDLAREARRIEERFGTTSQEYLDAWKRLSDWDTRSKAMQSELWHRMGMAQQGETDIDTGSFTGLSRAFKRDTGQNFTPKQAEEAKQQAAAVKKAEAEAEVATKAALDEVAKPPTIEPAVKSLMDRAMVYLDKRAADALARIKARRAEGRLYAGIDPEVLADYIDYGAAKLGHLGLQGAVTEARWAKAMMDDLGTDIGSFLHDIWERVNKTLDSAFEKSGASETAKRAKKAARQVRSITPEQAEKPFADYVPGREMQPHQVRALVNLVRGYIDNGETNFNDLTRKISKDLGLTVDDVKKGLTQRANVKRLADEMWRKQQDLRRVKEQAKRWLEDQKTPWWEKILPGAARYTFAAKVGFHGWVPFGTHAPALLFQPTKWGIFFPDMLKIYKMVGGAGKASQAKARAFYENEMQNLVRRDNFITARRAGLVNDPFTFEDYTDPKFFKAFPGLTGMGNRGYSTLKILRQDLFDRKWNKVSASSQTPEMARAIATGINHITGVTKGFAPGAAHYVLFAPRLEASRVMWMVGDPVKAAATLLNWKNATPEARMFATNQLKEKLEVMGTLTSLLALNAAILQLAGSRQKINFTNPMESDWLKFKIAGMNLSYGNPLVTMLRFPIREANIALSGWGVTPKRSPIYPDEKVATELWKYFRSQMSPLAGTATDLFFQSDFQERPLPASAQKVPRRLEAKGVEKYTWPEYASIQFTPIPISEGIREIWEKGLGLTPEQIKQTAKAFATILLMAGTGARVSEDIEPHALIKY